MNEVVVGIVNKEGKILMIKRVKKEGELVWAFPGGKVEPNETREEACVREVYEETGVNVEVQDILGERIHPNTNAKLTYFLCKYIDGELTILHSEEIDAIEYKTQEEFERDVKTDVYPPVKKYIKTYIKKSDTIED